MAITDTSAAQLIINQLTRDQYNNLVDTKAIVDNQLYIIDENILSSANEYFKTPVAQKDFQISAYADAAVVNKAYVTKVVSNINASLEELAAQHDIDISTKQDKLTDSNEGAYIDISANVDSSKTIIAVTNVVSAGTDISNDNKKSSLTTSKAVKEYVETKLTAKQDNLKAGSYITIADDNTISVSAVATSSDNIANSNSGLTTGKAVHDYVEAQIGTVDQAFIKSVKGDYVDGTTAKVSVEATTTNKAVALKIHTNDIASAQALTAHINDANKHVSADERNKWNSALQGITSTDTKYIDIEDNNKVKPVIVDVTLEKITADTTGIVPPSVIAALNAKVNDLQQIPHFSVVVAYSINLTAKTYKLTEGGVDNNCVQNTVYLVPDDDAVTGAHIEYLCYGESKTIEQIGTTEIDLSEYAKTVDIGGGFDEHGVKVNLSNGKLTGDVTPGSIVQGNTSVVTGGAVFDYVATIIGPGTHKHDIADVNDLEDALDAKQDNLKTGSHITIADDNTISVSDITNVSSDINANDTGLTTGKAVHDYVAAKTVPGSHKHDIADVNDLEDALDAKQDNLTAGSYITITDDDTISVSAVTTAGKDIVLGDDGLTTGNAVREALNNMIVFRKHT